MILSEADTNSMSTNVTGCCGKISASDVQLLVSSHEKLRAIIRCLKSPEGCWCDPLYVQFKKDNGRPDEHTAICRDIRKRVI